MGWNSQNVTNLLIVNAQAGGFSGIFVYSPSAGAGNLIGSWAAVAGTDPYGNAYNQGLTTYGSLTIVSPPALVQSVSGTATGATLTLTLPNPTTAGNCVFVCVASSSTLTNASISTVQLGGVTDHFARSLTQGVSTDVAIQETWADPNCAGGQTAVQITSTGGSGTTVLTGFALEFAGIVTSSPVDQAASNLSDTPFATWNSGTSGTTTQAVEVAIAPTFASASGSSLTINPTAGFTNLQQIFSGGAAGGAMMVSYEILSATGTVINQGTFSQSAAYAAQVVTFKAITSTITVHPQIVENEINGVLTKAFFTKAASELHPGSIHAEILNPGRPNEQIVFFDFGPQNSVSPDFAEIDLYSSPSNLPNNASGFLTYRTAAGAPRFMLAWGFRGVTRYSPAGMQGGIALQQADGFARTVTQSTPTPITFAYTIPANDQQGLLNVTYRIKCFGVGTQGSTAQSLGFQINVFGANWAPATFPAAFAGAGAGFSWEADLFITVVATGSTGTATSGGHMSVNSGNVGQTLAVHGARATVDTTAPTTMDLLISWGSATGAPTITCEASQLFREEP